MSEDPLAAIRGRLERLDRIGGLGLATHDELRRCLADLVRLQAARENDEQIWMRRIDDAGAERDAYKRNATLAVQRENEQQADQIAALAAQVEILQRDGRSVVTTEALREVLQRSYVILEGLRLGVEWELAPSIRAEIAAACEQVKAALATGAQTP
jgi:hypothetical protein